MLCLGYFCRPRPRLEPKSVWHFKSPLKLLRYMLRIFYVTEVQNIFLHVFEIIIRKIYLTDYTKHIFWEPVRLACWRLFSTMRKKTTILILIKTVKCINIETLRLAYCITFSTSKLEKKHFSWNRGGPFRIYFHFNLMCAFNK